MPAWELLPTLEAKVNPRHAALVVVDVQNDFCAPGGFWDRMGEDLSMVQKMVPCLLNLIDEARKAGVLVVFVQAIYDDQYISMPMRERRTRLQRDLPLCISGTWGSEFYQVQPREGDIVVQKHRWSAFAGTELDLILRSHGIQTLVMAGVATNVCVESTARDGFFLDYYVVYVEDAAATNDELLHRTALRNIEESFGKVVSSEDLTAVWQAVKQAPLAAISGPR